jgi:hypothetical protein
MSIKTLKWPLLKVVPPRVALSALNFCQPFLINRAITLSQQAINQTTTQIGYGLIGAYILVYVGIAVRAPASLAFFFVSKSDLISARYPLASISTPLTAPSPWSAVG